MKAQKLLLLVISLSAGFGLHASAASATWSGTGTGNTWDLNSNWGGTAFPGTSGTTDVATFNTASPGTITSLGQAAINIGQIVLGSSSGNVSISDSLSTDTLTFGTTAPISITGSESLTFDLNTTFTAASSIAAGSNLTFGGASSMILTTGNGLLSFTSGTVNIGSGVTIASGVASGTSNAGLNITGATTVNLGTNTYSGKFTSNAIQVSGGGTLNLVVNQNQKIVIGKTSASSANLFITVAGVTYNGPFQVAGGGTTASSASVYTIGANIAGGGTGTFNGATFSLNNNNSGNSTVILSAISGDTLNVSPTVAISGNSTGTTTTSGLFLQVSGGGTVVLGGSVANTFTTNNLVANGTEVKNNTILQLADTGGVALTGNTQVDSGSAIQLVGATNNQMTTTATLTLNGTGSAAGATGALESKTGTNTFGAVIAVGSTASGATITSDSGSALTLSGSISNGGNLLTVAGAGGTTVSNTISGIGGLTKSGSGTLTLGATNSYTGSTTISSGTLIVSGSTAAGSAVGISAGATLAGASSAVEGTLHGPVTVAGGGNINLVDGAIGTLTVGGLTSGGTTASVLTFEIGTGGTADSIATTTLALSNTTDITIDNLNGAGSQTITNGTYDLIGYTTLSSGTLGNLSLTDSTLDGHALSLTSLASGELVLTVSNIGGGTPAQAYWSGATNSSWATASNFNTSATSGTAVGAVPGTATDVVFSTTSPTPTNLSTTLDAATSINSLTFAGSGTVTIASGTGGSASTLTINAATTTGSGGLNTAPNGIIMQSGAGPATISAPVVLGASQTWSNASGNLLTISGGVTGTANLAIKANSTGGITFSGGSVNPVGSITNSGTGSGTTTISSAIGSNVTSVTQSGANSTLVLGSGNTYTGGTAVTAGELLITNGSSGSATGIGSTLSVGSNGTLGGIGASNSTSFNIAGKVIAGSGLANDTTGQTVITGQAVLHNSTFASATLSFNLNSANQNSTSINVGSTGVDFGSTTLSLTLKGNTIIAPFTSYILVAGVNTGSLGGVDGSQYEGITTAASGADGLAVGQYRILSGASLTFTYDLGFYSPGSFLYLNTVGGVDDIDVDVVPEPGTWAMLLGGLALLVMWQRRKNQTGY